MSNASYTNGPFTITRDTVVIDGQPWLGLRIDVTSGVIRLPIDDPRTRRKVELKAELACLRMVADEVAKALEEHENQEGN